MSLLVIQDARLLDKRCRELASCSWIGIDTEFLRVRTYYPRLCLVQVSSSHGVIGIDPIECETLEPLIHVLGDTAQTKVIHAARQDLEVLYHICGCVPQPVFDTQIAAALLGFGGQVSYASLVAKIAGKTLSKHETRTNWCSRPLTAGQLEYAYQDVSYLGELYQYLKAELERQGRLGWLEEECALLGDPGLYAVEPKNAYKRLRRGHSLDLPSQHLLKHLAVWRERTAQRKDLPRNWVAGDNQLIDIAAAKPQEREQLMEVKGVPSQFVHRYGNAVLSVIGKSHRGDGEELVWGPPTRLSDREKRLADRLIEIIKAQARTERVSSTLVASRKEVHRFVRQQRNHPLVTGWRFELVGRRLLQELETKQDD